MSDIKLHVEWDDYEADWVYILVKASDEYPTATGNASWADRIAQHYQIELPKPGL